MLIKFAQTNECQTDVYYFKVIKVTLEQQDTREGAS